MGEMGERTAADLSSRDAAQKLQGAGYEFQFADLHAALGGVETRK